MKFLSGIVVGVFFGALAVEILNRKYPGLIEKVETGSRRVADRAEDMFRRAQGQDGTTY